MVSGFNSSAVLDGWYSRTTENEHSNGNNFDTRTIQGTEENEENRNKPLSEIEKGKALTFQSSSHDNSMQHCSTVRKIILLC